MALSGRSTAATVRASSNTPATAPSARTTRRPAGRCVAAGWPDRQSFRSGRARARGTRVRGGSQGGCSGPWAPCLEPARDDHDLADEERRGGKAGERSERAAEHRSEPGLSAQHAVGRACASAPGRVRAVVWRHRSRSLSLPRARRCVPRRRRARAGFRSRSRARSRPCARGWSRRAGASRAVARQRNGTATASESRPNPTSTPCVVDSPSTGASAWLERQATSRTVGSRAAERRAETGAGASECASGSQLCTGAHPIFAARPARRSK